MVPEKILLRRVIELLIGKIGMANIRTFLCNNEQKCHALHDSSDQIPRQPGWLNILRTFSDYIHENLLWTALQTVVAVEKVSSLRDWKASWVNKQNTSGYKGTAEHTRESSSIGLSTNISLAILGVEKLILEVDTHFDKDSTSFLSTSGKKDRKRRGKLHCSTPLLPVSWCDRIAPLPYQLLKKRVSR
jgi:hypothetical protein